MSFKGQACPSTTLRVLSVRGATHAIHVFRDRIVVVTALLTLIVSTMRPPCAPLGRLPGTQTYVDLRRHPEAKRVKGVVIFGYGAALHFANKDHFRDMLFTLITARESPDATEPGHAAP